MLTSACLHGDWVNTNESQGIIFYTKGNKLMWSGMGDIVAAKSHGVITPQTETKKIASFT